MSEKTRLWGGRFAGDMNSLTSEYTAGADRELFELDIAASRAHARMLGATGIISESDATAFAPVPSRGAWSLRTSIRTSRPVCASI